MLRFLLLFLSCITVSLSNRLCYGSSNNETQNHDNGTCSLLSGRDYCFFGIDYRTVTRGCKHEEEGSIGPLACLNQWIHINNRSLYCCHDTDYCNGCPDIDRLCNLLASPLKVTNPPPECTSPLTCTSSSSNSMTTVISLYSILSSSVIVSNTSISTPNGLSQSYIIIIFVAVIFIVIVLLILIVVGFLIFLYIICGRKQKVKNDRSESSFSLIILSEILS